MFCKAFYVCYQMACIMLITLVLLLAHSCFGNHVGNFFQSINRSGIQSSCLWSICHENNNWPIFFVLLSLSWSKLFCFQWRLTKIHSVNPVHHKFYRKNCRSNLYHRSRRHICWPLDHHHSPNNGNPWLKQV